MNNISLFKEDNVSYFLSLSGGAFRGPVQYWVGYYLIRALKTKFRVIAGTSVGSINGSMFSQDKFEKLLEFYNGIKNKYSFLSPRIFYILGYPLVMFYRWILSLLEKIEISLPVLVGGLYSMGPLRKKLSKNLKLQDLMNPFVAGVVSSRTGKYYNLDTREMKSDVDFVDAVQASSCMVPFMKPPVLELEKGKGKEYGWDGGYRNIFPLIPAKDIEDAKKSGHKIIIHAVGCTSFKRVDDISNRKHIDEASMILRAVEFFEAEIFENDILQLRKQAGSNGAVHLWIPDEDVGGSMDASPETIQKRLEIGRRTVARGPIILSGLD